MKRILILALVAIMGAVCSVDAKTLSELRTAVRYKIGDSSSTTNSTTWTDAELNIRCNEVQKDIANLTRCIYTQAIATATAEVREYSKPEKCMVIDRVSFLQTTSTDSYKKLTAITMGGLDRDFPTWEYAASGLPRYYYERAGYIGFDRPVSSVYASTVAIKVDYYKYPDDMSADTDEPFDTLDYLTVFHDIIVLGVAVKCKQDENKWNESQNLQGEYIGLINLMIDSLYNLPDQRVQHIKIGS